VSATAQPEQFNLPADQAARDALAAEYVLGALDAETSARVAAAIDGDAAWRVAVQAWEARLAPLVALIRPEQAPPDLWDRIEARITPHRAYVPRAPRTAWIWKAWATIATLAAAGAAAFAFLPTLRLIEQPPLHLIGPLVTAEARAYPSFLADVTAAGELRLRPFPAVSGRAQFPPGRVLQIWAVLPGATLPMNLGLLPKEPAVMTIPRGVLQPMPDMFIEISLEEEGGSKTGRPVGPVLYIGRLFAVTAPD
jgi:anti-sigma-K factor RskA